MALSIDAAVGGSRGHGGELGKRFWALWAATAGSSLGDGMATVAFPLLAYHLTHSPVAVSVVYASGRVPALVLGIPAGVIADRVGRRRLAVGADTARLGVLAAFASVVVAGRMDVAGLCGTVFVLSALEQLYRAAVFASLPSIVDDHQLDRANGRLNVADIVVEDAAGQGGGGALFSLGASFPFFVDAASFLFSAVLVLRALPVGQGSSSSGQTLRSQALEGVRWFARQPVLRSTAVLIATFAMCQAAELSMLVVYVRQYLHRSEAVYGLLMGLSTFGTAAGSLGADRIVKRIGPVGALVVAGVGASLAYGLIGLDRNLVGAGIALNLDAASVTTGIVASVSLRQRLIPRELLGRVGMTFRTVIFAGVPVGALAAGAFATSVGLPEVFIGAGVLQLVMLLAWMADWRRRAPKPRPAHVKGRGRKPGAVQAPPTGHDAVGKAEDDRLG